VQQLVGREPEQVAVDHRHPRHGPAAGELLDEAVEVGAVGADALDQPLGVLVERVGATPRRGEPVGVGVVSVEVDVVEEGDGIGVREHPGEGVTGVLAPQVGLEQDLERPFAGAVRVAGARPEPVASPVLRPVRRGGGRGGFGGRETGFWHQAREM
jgi:hypothetical protein